MQIQVISPRWFALTASDEGIPIAFGQLQHSFRYKDISHQLDDHPKYVWLLKPRHRVQGYQVRQGIPMFTAERFYNIPGNKVACPYRVFQSANKFFLQMDRKSIIAENPLFDLEGIRTFHVGVFAMQLEKREPRIKSFSKKL
jgi:hypothetical protein